MRTKTDRTDGPRELAVRFLNAVTWDYWASGLNCRYESDTREAEFLPAEIHFLPRLDLAAASSLCFTIYQDRACGDDFACESPVLYSPGELQQLTQPDGIVP